MTENLKNAMLGINSFVWMAIGYDTIPYQFQFSDRQVYLPRFIVETPWTCNTDHFASKWLGIAEGDRRGYGRLIEFYLELDNSNKLALMEWIMNNPVDSRQLSFPNNEED